MPVLGKDKSIASDKHSDTFWGHAPGKDPSTSLSTCAEISTFEFTNENYTFHWRCLVSKRCSAVFEDPANQRMSGLQSVNDCDLMSSHTSLAHNAPSRVYSWACGLERVERYTNCLYSQHQGTIWTRCLELSTTSRVLKCASCATNSSKTLLSCARNCIPNTVLRVVEFHLYVLWIYAQFVSLVMPWWSSVVKQPNRMSSQVSHLSGVHFASFVAQFHWLFNSW